MCKQGIFSQQECQYLNIKQQSATIYRSHSGLVYIYKVHVSVLSLSYIPSYMHVHPG